MLVRAIEITNDADVAARRLAARVPNLTADQGTSAPFAWVGTVGQIASQLRDYGRRWGISRYVIRADPLDHARHALE